MISSMDMALKSHVYCSCAEIERTDDDPVSCNCGDGVKLRVQKYLSEMFLGEKIVVSLSLSIICPTGDNYDS